MIRAVSPKWFIVLPVCACLDACTTTPKVTYQNEVRRILADKCNDCHKPPYGIGYLSTGLDTTSYKTLMTGSIYGPVVIPGNSRKSPLNMLVEGRAGDLTRTLQTRHKSMTDDEIRQLRLWVEQGAKD